MQMRINKKKNHNKIKQKIKKLLVVLKNQFQGIIQQIPKIKQKIKIKTINQKPKKVKT